MANEVRIDISAQTSKYERAMRDVRLSTEKTTSFISSAWLKAAGALYSVMKGWEMMKMAARADQERAAFESLAASYGANANYIIAKLKEASAHTIDTMTLIEKAGTAMMMGLAPDKLSRLMEIARATARMTGQDVTKAFEDISLAVGRQSRMILDNLGIIVKVSDANEEYARTLGKTAGQLTEAEKRQAFLNATIKAGDELIRRLGDQTKTTAEHFQSLEALTKDIMIYMGRALQEIVRWILMGFTEAGVIINLTFEQIFKGWSLIMGLIAELPGGKLLGFDELSGWLENLSQQFKGARMEGEAFVSTLWNLKSVVPTAGPSPGAVFGGGGEETALWENVKEWEKYHNELIKEATRYDQEMIAAHEATYQYELEQIRERLEMEAEIKREWREWQIEEATAYDQALIEGHEAYKQREVDIEERTQQMKIQALQNWMQTSMNFLNAMATFGLQKSKLIFGVAKALEVGQATMAAFAAFNMALAHPPGPPTTIPMANAALAMGLSNAALIAATSFGQLAASTGGGGTSAGGGYETPGLRGVVPSPISPEIPGEKGPKIKIIFEGDVRIEDEAYIEELAERISDAVEEREVRLVASSAKYAEGLS